MNMALSKTLFQPQTIAASTLVLITVAGGIFVEPLPRDPIKTFLNEDSAIFKKGNYTIGGLFSAQINYDPEKDLCYEFNPPGILYIQAMIYAIEKANPILRDGVTLGYYIVNDCYNIDRAMQAGLQLMIGNDPVKRRNWVTKRSDIMKAIKRDQDKDRDDLYKLESPVLATVGAANSDMTAGVASLFSVNLVPLVSYSATSPRLSDKSKFPSFLRTIPPDGAQVTAMADLITHFNWTWVSVIATDDSYGRYGLQLLKEILNDRAVCLAREELIDSRLTNSSVEAVLDKLESDELSKRAKVVVFICSGAKVEPFLKIVKAKNMIDRIWIASESWGYRVYPKKYAKVLSGSLGIATDTKFPKDFFDYLLRLPFHKANRWLQEYLNKEAANHGELIWTLNHSNPLGTHPAFLTLGETWSIWFSQVPQVLNAVNSVITSVKSALTKKSLTKGNARILYPYEILRYLHTVEFKDYGTKNGTFKFNNNGDIMGGYKVNSIMEAPPNLVKFELVGKWDGTNWTLDNPMRPQETEFDKRRLQLNEDLILWKNNTKTLPRSSCRTECLPGTYKIFSSLRCCWTCNTCAQGKFTVADAQTRCKLCPKGMTNNADHTGCVYVEQFIDWKSPGELIMLTFAGLGQIGVLIVAIVLVKYRKTPVVICSNRLLNFILLFLLYVSFCLPFLFIVRPSPVLCSAEALIFGVVFSTITAILLVKTRHVLQIFNSKFNSMQDTVYRRELWQSGLFALISIIIAVPYLAINPPQPLPHSADCGTNWTTIQLVNMGYIMLLSVIATAMAFKARHLPENYNETGTISTTMLLLLLVWVACIPSYYRVFVRQRTLLLCIAINAAAFVILGLLFGSKVYIIFWEPHKNTQGFVARMNMIHIWKKYNKAQRKKTKRMQTLSEEVFESETHFDGKPSLNSVPKPEIQLTRFKKIDSQ